MVLVKSTVDSLFELREDCWPARLLQEIRSKVLSFIIVENINFTGISFSDVYFFILPQSFIIVEPANWPSTLFPTMPIKSCFSIGKCVLNTRKNGNSFPGMQKIHDCWWQFFEVVSYMEKLFLVAKKVRFACEACQAKNLNNMLPFICPRFRCVWSCLTLLSTFILGPFSGHLRPPNARFCVFWVQDHAFLKIFLLYNVRVSGERNKSNCVRHEQVPFLHI